MLKVKRLILIFALLFSNLTITLFADTNQRITDIRFWQSPEEAQVVLDLSEPPKVSDVGRLNKIDYLCPRDETQRANISLDYAVGIRADGAALVPPYPHRSVGFHRLR